VLVLLALSSALADLPAEDRWVASDSVAVGLHADGSLVNPAIDLGLKWDPDGPLGPAPLGGDILIAGYPWETWSIEYTAGSTQHTAVCGGPHLASDLVFDWDEPVLTAAMEWIHGAASTAHLDLDVWVAASLDQDVVWLDTRISAKAAVSDLAVARVVDADFDATTTGAYTTLNQAGPGWASAESTWDGRALALAAVDGEGGLCSWCTLPDQVADGSTGPSIDDAQLGVALWLGDLAVGEHTTATVAYGLALGDDFAVDLALEAAASVDRDGDGLSVEEGDCDDREPLAAPGLIEWADGVDNDCDGEVDEDTVLSDDDEDGWTEAQGDCDDADDRVHPEAGPVDGVADADCDGEDDDGSWPAETGDHPVTRDEEVSACATAPGLGLLAWPLLVLVRRRRC